MCVQQQTVLMLQAHLSFELGLADPLIQDRRGRARVFRVCGTFSSCSLLRGCAVRRRRADDAVRILGIVQRLY